MQRSPASRRLEMKLLVISSSSSLLAFCTDGSRLLIHEFFVFTDHSSRKTVFDVSSFRLTLPNGII